MTILAFGVASYHLGAKSLWLDEAASADFTSYGLAHLGDIVSGGDPNMSLYYGLLYFWRELFGSGEIALRSLTVLLGGLAVPVMVLLGTELFGRAAGLVSGLLLALSPFFVHYEQTARSYAFVVLLAVLSSYFFVRELQRPSRATRVGFVLVSALAVYAQYLAALVLLVQALTLLAFERRAAFTRKWLVDAGAIAILCVPQAVFALRKGTVGIDWIPAPSLSDLIDLPSELAGGRFLLIALLILACFGFFRAIQDRLLRPAGYVAAWFLVPLFLVFAVSELGRPLFLPHYLIFILPALLLLASAGLVRLPGRVTGIVPLGVLIAASAVGISDWYREPSLEDYRGATRFILKHERPGDQVIYYPFYISSAFDYYETQDGGSLPSEAEPAAHPPRIWLAVRFGDPPPQISQSLAGAYKPVAARSHAFPNPVVTLYQARSTPSATPGNGNVGETNGGAPTAGPSNANLKPFGLSQAWRLAPPPPESLANHLFACLDLLGPDQPSSAISATGPAQLKMISDVLGWPTATDARSAAAALMQGSDEAKSCVASSLHFATTDFSIPGPGDAGVEVNRQPPGSLGGGKGASRLPASIARETPVYELHYSGPSGAARGSLLAIARGRATAVILAYRTGEQPLPPTLLPGLVARAYQRLDEAVAAGG